MTQRGTHTWDLILHYHRCPKCGWIIESREDYQERFGKEQKDLQCQRCGHSFTLTKVGHRTIGPIFGKGDHAEVDWS